MIATTQQNLRYGAGRLSVRVPASSAVLTGPSIPAAPNALAAVQSALADPIASPPFAQIVRQKRPRSVAITISDITRPVPNEPIITALLDVLNREGIADSQVVIIIGTGMHRPSTPEERRIMLGDALLKRLEVIDHVADDAASVTRVSDDPPVSVNSRFLNADLRIVTGLIEPHFMAGFSGGRKGVCPGLVDLKTVQRFHGHRTMGDPASVEGRLDGNPCHEISLKVARIVGVDFLVNVAITHDRRLAAVYAGDMVEAHLAGCRQVAEWTTARMEGDRTRLPERPEGCCVQSGPVPFDLVITSAGGFPLDQNFYQSVKGMVTALPALHTKSTLLIVSACREIGSEEYTSVMLRYANDWRAFLRDIAEAPHTAKDQWQYQMHARVLERIGVERLFMANDGLAPDVLAKLSVTPLSGPGDAAARAQRFIDEYVAANPQARIAVIPEGPYVMLK